MATFSLHELRNSTNERAEHTSHSASGRSNDSVCNTLRAGIPPGQMADAPLRDLALDVETYYTNIHVSEDMWTGDTPSRQLAAMNYFTGHRFSNLHYIIRNNLVVSRT
jgi:hypothetical protein